MLRIFFLLLKRGNKWINIQKYCLSIDLIVKLVQKQFSGNGKPLHLTGKK